MGVAGADGDALPGGAVVFGDEFAIDGVDEAFIGTRSLVSLGGGKRPDLGNRGVLCECERCQAGEEDEGKTGHRNGKFGKLSFGFWDRQSFHHEVADLRRNVAGSFLKTLYDLCGNRMAVRYEDGGRALAFDRSGAIVYG